MYVGAKSVSRSGYRRSSEKNSCRLVFANSLLNRQNPTSFKGFTTAGTAVIGPQISGNMFYWNYDAGAGNKTIANVAAGALAQGRNSGSGLACFCVALRCAEACDASAWRVVKPDRGNQKSTTKKVCLAPVRRKRKFVLSDEQRKAFLARFEQCIALKAKTHRQEMREFASHHSNANNSFTWQQVERMIKRERAKTKKRIKALANKGFTYNGLMYLVKNLLMPQKV